LAGSVEGGKTVVESREGQSKKEIKWPITRKMIYLAFMALAPSKILFGAKQIEKR
jgi:hypothetical protein